MKYQPNANYVSNDVIMTPPDLARRIVQHFVPYGQEGDQTFLDPCAGERAFLNNFPPANSYYCELSEGIDFMKYDGPHVDWIITNPPWSKVRPFLAKAMEVSWNTVFLMTVNHLWTKARVKMIRDAGCSIREICLVDYPKEWPASGFQLAAIHISKHPQKLLHRSIELSHLNEDDSN